MDHTEENNLPGLLLLVDFEKAFDSVLWSFIYKVLEYFGYGKSIITWIKLFNNNAKLRINQGGILSTFFQDADRVIRYSLLSSFSVLRFWQ